MQAAGRRSRRRHHAERSRGLCLGFVKRFDLPRPRVNVVIKVDDGEYEVDCVFPGRVILEIDSWTWHGNRPARRRDNKRDRVLTLAGYKVVRAFQEELDDALASEIRGLIGDALA